MNNQTPQIKAIKHVFIGLIGLLQYPVIAQNIGINSTGATPDASAILDVVSSDKGMLIPRVALTATNAAGPITSPATSMLVYNTATDGTTPNDVTPGYYYWDGATWIAFGGTGGKDWSLNGNAGTTASTAAIGATVNNNFIGTTDAIDYVLATNNLERMRISSGGNIGFGLKTSSSLEAPNVFTDGKLSIETTNHASYFMKRIRDWIVKSGLFRPMEVN